VISSWSGGCDARFFGAAGPGPGPGWVVGLWAFCGSGFAAGLDGARCVHQRVVFRDEGSGGPAARRNCQVICWPLAAAGGLGNARLHPGRGRPGGAAVKNASTNVIPSPSAPCRQGIRGRSELYYYATLSHCYSSRPAVLA
jgi:hypothetical protein